MLICKKCGGSNVEHAYWVNPNTNEVVEHFGTWCHGDNSWCNDCGEHVELVDPSERALDEVLKNKERLYENVRRLATIFNTSEEVILTKLKEAAII